MEPDQDLNRPLPFFIDLNQAPPPLPDVTLPPPDVTLPTPPPPLHDVTPPPPPSDHDVTPPPPPPPPPPSDQFLPYEAYSIACRFHAPKPAPPSAPAPAEFPGEAGLSLPPAPCGQCGQAELPGQTVVCDACERGFHVSCARVPTEMWRRRVDEWVCEACQLAGLKGREWREPPAGGRAANLMLDINAPPPSESEETQLALGFNMPNSSDVSPLSGNFATIAPTFVVNNPPLLTESSSRGGFYYPDLKQFMPAFNAGPGSMYVPMEIDSINDNNLVPQRLPSRRKRRVRTNIFTSAYLSQNQNRNLDQTIMDLEALQPRFADSSTPPKLPKYLIEENGRYIQLDLKAGFPIQFEDFYLVKLGELDSRVAFHTNFEIHPIGFTSYWHDKITGSLFEFEVSDSGNNFPLFTVRRIPCSAFPLPNCSTVLCYNNNNSKNRDINNEKGENSNASCVTTAHEESDDILILLDDPCQSDQDLNDCLKGTLVNTQIGSKSGEIIATDRIGEFFVQGDNLQSVWSKVTCTLFDAICESYRRLGYVQFCCNHGNEGQKINAENLNNLARFSHVYGPLGVPKLSRDVKELEASSLAIKEWLDRDRSGLDLEFVQEIIENVFPACINCPRYQVLSKRSDFLSSFTVASENLVALIRNGEKGVIEGLYGSGKNHGDRKLPLGKIVSKNLPAKLAGDVFQILEFLHRFKEPLGLTSVPSFEELETELLNPWPETLTQSQKLLDSIQTTDQNQAAQTLNPNGDDQTGDDNQSQPPTLIPIETSSNPKSSQANLSQSATLLAQIHTSLLKLLINEIISRVACFVDPTIEIKESKPRRGRRKDVESSTVNRESKVDLLTFNVLTWHELARRYALVAMNFGDLSDVSCSEGVKIFRCLQGDGGVVFGAASGIAGIEADASILVEAQKQISDDSPQQTITITENPNPAASSAADLAPPPAPPSPDASEPAENSVPEWARPLENVRKLPTNVGTRIRNCVFEALQRNPPDWARKLLEHSISKGIYKGNASGPTKKTALSVLADATVGKKPQTQNPKPAQQQKPQEKKPPKKERISLSVSDAVTKKCRIILREALATVSDKMKNLCNILGTSLVNSDEEEFEGVIGFACGVSRPLDFRTIDLRLTAGAYCGSHEAFLEDVREVLQNLRTVSAEKLSQFEKIDTLSASFESLYENEVLTLVSKLASYSSTQNPSEAQQKEILETLDSLETLKPAPWEDGVCKVCGVDRDDKSVLLCDTCDSEYHTYCLNPPLARIPEGNWYCPSCVKKKKGKGKEKEMEASSEKKREAKRNGEVLGLGFKAVLSQFVGSMERKEYWELGVDERVFLLKFLCDELLSSVLREHIEMCVEKSLDFQQKLRSSNLELRSLKVREDLLSFKSMNNLGNVNNITASNDESNTETGGEMVTNQDSIDENNNNSSTNNDNENASNNNNNVEMENLRSEILALQDTIMDLESQLSRVCLRKEFIGKDVSGRLYWFITRPDKRPCIVVDGSSQFPRSEPKSRNPNPTIKTGISKSRSESEKEVQDTFIVYESDEEANSLLDWLNDGDSRERELRESILSLQRVAFKIDDCLTESPAVHFGKELVSPVKTKALSVLESRYGIFSDEEMVPKRPKKKGKLNNDDKIHRCECFEPVWGSKNHCFVCHISFLTQSELETHNDGKCATKMEIKTGEEGLNRGAKSENNMKDKGGIGMKCPFDFDEICKKFVVKGSIKEDVQQIGLIGSNGVPSFITRPVNYLDPDHPAVLFLNQKEKSRNDIVSQNNISEAPQNTQTDVQTSNEEQSKEETSDNNKVGCTVPDAALRPIMGRNSQILKLLKINLLDMEAALLDEALKRVKSDPVKLQKWRFFVKSSNSIYEMVQATVLLESMVKTEYIKNAWFHWSSFSAAVKTPSLTSLALRIYTLDDCLIYVKDLANNASVNSEVVSDVSTGGKSSSKGKKRKDLD